MSELIKVTKGNELEERIKVLKKCESVSNVRVEWVEGNEFRIEFDVTCLLESIISWCEFNRKQAIETAGLMGINSTIASEYKGAYTQCLRLLEEVGYYTKDNFNVKFDLFLDDYYEMRGQKNEN